MSKKYSLILKNGKLIDALTPLDSKLDLGIAHDKIVAIAPDLNPDLADQCLDVQGLTILPGIIDSHAHLSPVFGGLAGHIMLAQAGITTVMDMAGPSLALFTGASQVGTGLNLLSLEALTPGRNIQSNNPATSEIANVLQRVQAQGGIGLKIMGNPYALTPEATQRVIGTCAPKGYVGIHAGSTNHSHNYAGFLEMLEIIGKYQVHLAHINVYCRHPKNSAQEAAKALQLLKKAPHLWTESYISPYSASTAKLVSGHLKSLALQDNLKALGLSPDVEGLQQAILQGQAIVSQNLPQGNLPLRGQSALDYWQAQNTRVDVFLPTNPWLSRLLLASAKNAQAEFIIPSLCSDGGGMLRNTILSLGLSMVDLGLISLTDFVRKTSVNPARMLGLQHKGQLKIGYDADLTIINLSAKQAVHSLALGKFILQHGRVCGTKATAYCLASGQAQMQELGLNTQILEPANFYGQHDQHSHGEYRNKTSKNKP